MKKNIPNPVIAVLADSLPTFESHASIDNLFLFADAPSEPPEGSKQVKVNAWLKQINKECDFPLVILGKIIEPYMELPESPEPQNFFGAQFQVADPKQTLKTQLEKVLARCNLFYISGGIISDGTSPTSKALSELIQGRDIPSIDAEFERALSNVNTEPREAVSAACNILESIFKVYIEDENLEKPQKQDLQNVWKVVRKDLGFNTNSLEDDDLKKILSGILSVVDGIGAFRTHASSAHGPGRKIYNLKPRHARLAVHSAHTIALFVLETWDERKATKAC
ncbi:abortive infection family protein [Photobacterium sp. MCCC 1A19761]|uniref:abortive infection family protein n=1 Tax=Photobacterium sp. MCCC 1A19761 TaxID=3115000 RepID=UPI00307CDB83